MRAESRSVATVLLLVPALLAPIGAPANPFENVHTHAQGHAPIGVMGDHMHAAGEFMLSYRYVHMRMKGNRDGSHDLTPGDVLASGFLATPTDMDVDMHVFGAMWAPWDRLTLMAMLPYAEKSMDHVNAMGVRFETSSEGIGDFSLTGLIRLWQNERHHVHLNAGVGFPTGSIDERDQIPVPMLGFQSRRLPYPMQIGSGSYSLLPGITYTGRIDDWSWGGQAKGTVYLDENDRDYRVGDRAELNAWVQHAWVRWLSTSFRVRARFWGNYAGADPDLNPAMVPTADPNLRGGEDVALAPGLNLVLPLGPLGEHRLAIEALLPVRRDLNGPQLESDWTIVAGWQLAF